MHTSTVAPLSDRLMQAMQARAGVSAGQCAVQHAEQQAVPDRVCPQEGNGDQHVLPPFQESAFHAVPCHVAGSGQSPLPRAGMVLSPTYFSIHSVSGAAPDQTSRILSTAAGLYIQAARSYSLTTTAPFQRRISSRGWSLA